jgi:hypothetical protein
MEFQSFPKFAPDLVQNACLLQYLQQIMNEFFFEVNES